jgi:hypothetical protein
VGCDQELGSAKEEDECGVCGGDGTTCQPHADQPVTGGARSKQPGKQGGKQQDKFEWKETAYSECSVSCGIGEWADDNDAYCISWP